MNANILYNLNAERKLTQLVFCIVAIIELLLEGHMQLTSTQYYAPSRIIPLCLTEKPFPEWVPSVAYVKSVGLKGNAHRPMTHHRCKVCHTALHIESHILHYHRLCYPPRPHFLILIPLLMPIIHFDPPLTYKPLHTVGIIASDIPNS